MTPRVSSVARRTNAPRSLSGEGASPLASNLARTNASIGVRAHFFCLTAGTSWLLTGWYDHSCDRGGAAVVVDAPAGTATAAVAVFAPGLSSASAAAPTAIPDRKATKALTRFI